MRTAILTAVVLFLAASASAGPSGLVANFTYTPAQPTTEDNVTFTDQSSGGVTSWQWDFGDGTTSEQKNAVKRYSTPGTYTVKLTVFRSPDSASTEKTLTIQAAPPVSQAVEAAFTYLPAQPQARQTIAFSDRSTGIPASWFWTFGDGNTSDVQNPTHAYTTAGTYTVFLTVTNPISLSTTSQIISVTGDVRPYRSLVSATAQTNGIGGTFWRTELTLFNAGNEVVNVDFTFIPDAAGTIQTRSIAITPRQSVTYANALLELFSLSVGSGALAIDATSAASTPLLKVSSRTFTTAALGSYGQAVPEVDPAQLDPNLFITGMTSNAAYRTNIGLVNRSDAAVSATLTLLERTGATVGTADVIIAPRSFQQNSLATYIPNVGLASYEGLSMRIASTSGQAISAYASVIDNITQDPIYIQALPAPTVQRMIIPAVGRAPGLNDTFWRSDVHLFNPSTATISIGIRYLIAGQNNLDAPVTSVILAPNRTAVLSDVIGSFGFTISSGALELSWTGGNSPVVTSRTYTSVDSGGTYGQAIDATSTFLRETWVPGLRSDANFRTNVGFFNSSTGFVDIAVSIINASGQILGTRNLTLAPQSGTQTAVSNLFGSLNAASIGAFTLQARTISGAPVVIAYGSIVDNVSGDPVYFAGR